MKLSVTQMRDILRSTMTSTRCHYYAHKKADTFNVIYYANDKVTNCYYFLNLNTVLER